MSALSFNGVSAGYAARDVLRDVTLAIRTGAVTGIVGPNGAGKTSLFRAALGLLQRAKGQIRIHDRALEDLPRETLAQTIAYLPQGAEAHWPIAARQLVALGRLPYRRRFAQPDSADWLAVDKALSRCEAESFATRSIDTLSAGERARVLLARALATQSPILLADEPAAHLDPAHQLQLMALLQEEARRGAAVAVTLHDLSLASRFCDEIVVMDQGRVAAQAVPDQALTDTVLAQVFQVAAIRVKADDRQMALIVTTPL